MILRCVHLGELPRPSKVHRSVGAVYPVRPLLPGSTAQSQVQGDTRRKNNSCSGQLSSSGVSSSSNYRSLPVRRGLDAPGAEGADLHSSGPPCSRSFLAALCLRASACPAGSAGSCCVPWGPVLQGLHHWNCTPGRAASSCRATTARAAPGLRSPLRSELPPDPLPELLQGPHRGRTPAL